MKGKSRKEQLEVKGWRGSTLSLSTGTEAVKIPLASFTHFKGSSISSNRVRICSEFSFPLGSIILMSISLVGRLKPVTVEPKKESFKVELN